MSQHASPALKARFAKANRLTQPSQPSGETTTHKRAKAALYTRKKKNRGSKRAPGVRDAGSRPICPVARVTDVIECPAVTAVFRRLYPNGYRRPGEGDPVSFLVTFTQAMIEELLRNNDCNRGRHADELAVLTKAMRGEGEFPWFPNNPQAIIILVTADGKFILFNGQHRLTAASRLGTDIMMTVAFIDEVDMMKIFDTGKARTTKDKLRIGHGIADASVTAYANVHYYTRMDSDSQSNLKPAQVKRWHDHYESDAEWAASVKDIKAGTRVLPLHALGVFVFAHARHPEAVDAIAISFITGAGLSPGDPVLEARNTYFAIAGEKNRFYVSRLILTMIYNKIHGIPFGGEVKPSKQALKYFNEYHDSVVSLSELRGIR